MLCQLHFVCIFYFFRRAQAECEPKESIRVGSFAQNRMSQTKVTAHTYKSFGQAFSKACGNPKGKARGRLRRGETLQAHSNEQSKNNGKAKQKVKIKSAMQLKKVGTTDVTTVTI